MISRMISPSAPHLGGDGDRHAQGDASLGEQGNAQVFAHPFASHFINLDAAEAPAILPMDREDVGDTDAHHGQLPKYPQVNSAPLSTKKRM